jgi:hypothetical protein
MSLAKKIKAHGDHEDSKYLHIDFSTDEEGKIHHASPVHPHTYVKVKDKHDLDDLLEYFGHHVMWKDLVPPTPWARRNFIERIRPALRFYCEKYQVTVPGWLSPETDKKFTELPPSKQQELFGKDQIKIVEFKKLNVPPLFPSVSDPRQKPAAKKPPQ